MKRYGRREVRILNNGEIWHQETARLQRTVRVINHDWSVKQCVRDMRWDRLKRNKNQTWVSRKDQSIQELVSSQSHWCCTRHSTHYPFGPSLPNVLENLKFTTSPSCTQKSGESPIAFRLVKDNSGSRYNANIIYRAALISETHKLSDTKKGTMAGQNSSSWETDGETQTWWTRKWGFWIIREESMRV